MHPRYFRITFWDHKPYAILGDGRLLPVGTARFTLNSGKWYDAIRGDKGGLVVSARAAEALQELTLPHGEIIEYTPFLATEFGDIAPPPFKYYHWKPVSTLSIDDEFYAQGISGPIMRWHPPAENNITLAYGIGQGRTSRCLICTIDVLLLARKYKLTNFWFRPLDYPNTDSSPPFHIEHLRREWPPAWYPDGFEPDRNNLVDDYLPDPLRHP